MFRPAHLLTAAVAISAFGLSGQHSIANGTSACYGPNSLTALAPADRQTVVITDPTLLRASGDFSLAKTLGNIITTATGDETFDTAPEREALLNGLIRSMRVLKRPNPDSGVDANMTPRPGEVALLPADMLMPDNDDEMIPVGLFNRLDLAPNTWAYCGEHRIVYMKQSASITDRMSLIFEAALPNPHPEDGAEGCRPVAEFWNSLGGMTGDGLREALRKFYYVGLDADGDGVSDFAPVVASANYGVPFGQVRGNLFADPPPLWQLREWRIALGPDKSPQFVADTVKNNPMPELFGPGAAGDSDAVKALRAQFQSEFVNRNVGELVSIEVDALAHGGKVDPGILIAKLGTGFNNRYNDFESTSQTAVDNPRAIAGSALLAKIDQKLADLGVAGPCQLTAPQVLARVGANSCGGCHEFSVEPDPDADNPFIAPGVAWPALAGRFVHIKEDNGISVALENFFLPARRQNLVKFLTTPAIAMAAEMSAPVMSQQSELERQITEVQAAPTQAAAIAALSAVEASVEALRQQDQQQPGAFVEHRRTH